MATAGDASYSLKEVAAHKNSEDAWMVIHGEVYNVSTYLHDHPGGADVLLEAAGVDASEAFDNAGHSDDASEIMAAYRIGTVKGAPAKKSAPRPALVSQKSTSEKESSTHSSTAPVAVGAVVVAFGALAAGYAYHVGSPISLPRRIDPAALIWFKASQSEKRGLGFAEGFVIASSLFTAAGSVIAKKLSKLLQFGDSFATYAPHKKMAKTIIKPDTLLQRGWLDPSHYQFLPLTKKELIAPNVYLFRFELPTSDAILGLPTGQHVAIKAEVDGKSVSRSYTPVSNNADEGVLDLVIKCYPDGLLTGGYLANLEVGDEVQFRGPKGAMRYHRGLCKQIGMLAGGTGITPMYQLIRAICEDDKDTTEISLIYANRTEEDILLREELETFARRYPQNLKVHYLLDRPPAGWTYGSGFVTKEIMEERFPSPGPESKILLCGPPPMVNAAKKSLVSLGFEQPGASAKMTDQVFTF